MSDVDVIVLDWNGGERLSRCLESIAAQTLPPARVIVFDNGSQPPTDASLPGGSVLILRSDDNLGFTGGINEAMTRVDAPFVAWVNNDVVLDREWLASVRPLFDRDPRLAAAQTIIRGEGATIDGAGVVIARGRFLQAYHGEPLTTDVGQPWGISGTAALFRVSALRDVALQDEVLHSGFFAYYEDVELSARLRNRGWNLELLPKPLALHSGSASESQLGRCREHLRTRNRYYVARVHPGVGRISSLLYEDARRFARFVVTARLSDAVTIAKAVVKGMVGRIAGG